MIYNSVGYCFIHTKGNAKTRMLDRTYLAHTFILTTMKTKFNLFLLLPFLIMSCSRSQTFENSLFKLHYPNNYRESDIYNAPHMLIKLESKDALFSISYWEYNIDKDIDAWDDLIFERYKVGLSKSELVFSKKVILNIKNEKLRAIKIFSNIQSDCSVFGNMSYVFIKNGNLYVTAYIQPRTITHNSNSKDFDKILSGLVFNEHIEDSRNSNKSLEEFENDMLNLYKRTNQTLPMKIDEFTTLFSITCVGKTIMFKYRVEPNSYYNLDEEWERKFKERTITNMMSAIPNADVYASYMSKSSLQIVYTFFDKNNNLIRTLKITSKDFKL